MIIGLTVFSYYNGFYGVRLVSMVMDLIVYSFSMEMRDAANISAAGT
jgi:hypothetical protein